MPEKITPTKRIQNPFAVGTEVKSEPFVSTQKKPRKFSSLFVRIIDASEEDEPKTRRKFSSLFRIFRNREAVAAISIAFGVILVTLGVMLAFSFALGLVVGGSLMLVIGVLLGLTS